MIAAPQISKAFFSLKSLNAALFHSVWNDAPVKDRTLICPLKNACLHYRLQYQSRNYDESCRCWALEHCICNASARPASWMASIVFWKVSSNSTGSPSSLVRLSSSWILSEYCNTQTNVCKLIFGISWRNSVGLHTKHDDLDCNCQSSKHSFVCSGLLRQHARLVHLILKLRPSFVVCHSGAPAFILVRRILTFFGCSSISVFWGRLFPH